MFNLNNSYPYQPEVNNVVLKLAHKVFKKSKDISILDVGCGRGLTSVALDVELDTESLHGIDFHNKYNFKKNNKFLYIHDDLLNFKSLKKIIKTKKYDLIIFSDVLEHLYDPVSVVNFYKSFLKANGKIIITVPNIANIFSRISLFFGNFKYHEKGVMDKTHIRFFNRSNLKILCEETNNKILLWRYDSIIVRHLFSLVSKNQKIKNINDDISDSRLYKFYFKFIRPFEEIFSTFLPSLFAFRLGVIIEPK